MRIRFAKLLTLLVILLNVVAFHFVWLLIGHRSSSTSYESSPFTPVRSTDSMRIQRRRNIDETIQNNVTIVIRGFESFENDIPNTIRSITSTYPKINILLISETPPYPPLLLNSTDSLFQNVKQVFLRSSLNNSFESRTPLLQLKTSHVLFMPDSARIHTKKTVETMFKIMQHEKRRVVAASFKATKPMSCLSARFNPKEWAAQFEEMPGIVCDFVKGKHATLVKTEILSQLTDPFMLPFPDSFYLQAAAQSVKTRVMRELPLGSGKELYNTPHNQWKFQQMEKDHTHNMFRSLGLKKIVRENGKVEWYGCRRDTVRCFGTVIDDTPPYLWEGKWTPPCCLAGLRKTARHVFQQLKTFQVRYWLEGGSLLGATRSGDILPWDYDVDVGIYKDDITKCVWLLKAKQKPTADEQGFIWEKASEGDFYRVHYSNVNRLHVDIFPFYSKNGTMTKNTWFKTHKQDMEFPEHFLRPLSTIEFVGSTVSAPNNIHDFLELKFGEGAVENAMYPNPQKMARLGLMISPEKPLVV